jgi:betaine-aldehyde dehydrogenase
VTGQLRATVEPATVQACDAALEAAHQVQPQWHREFSPMERSQLLLRAANLFLQDEESQRIARLETEDTGRPISETQWEASGAADCLQWFAGLTRSMGGQYLEIPSSKANSKSSSSNNWGYTRREPLGVTVGIGAWNYPLQSVIWKSAPSLAFGNTMVFKPSEFTPQTALRVAEIYQHVGVPDGVFNVVLGTGTTVGKKLVEDPRVAKVSFTGSVPTGRQIYTSAAQDFKRVTLELGGKSPLILWEDANLDSAVSAAMMANWMSTGQVCSNGTRVFVHRNMLDAFIDQLLDRTAKLKIGDPTHPETQIGPLMNEAHRKKVQEYIRIGIEDDQADLIYGGRRTLTDEFPNGNFLEPTVFVCKHDEMRIVQEEIFGPVLAILPFDTEEEVIHRANNTHFGLAAGVFTKDLQRAHRMVAQLTAGTIWINSYNLAPVELPWGGFGHSGIGSENGVAGVESWTRMKSCYVEMNEMESPY